jgi:hypothetical protein
MCGMQERRAVEVRSAKVFLLFLLKSFAVEIDKLGFVVRFLGRARDIFH